MNRYAFLALALLAAAGCLQPETRLQKAEESERDKDLHVCLIADVSEVANVMPLPVSGVGLVTGLAGTGGSPLGSFRDSLEKQLLKKGIEHVKGVLDSHDNALVLVTALIPAGARRGDALDLEVTLPAGSKATSLAGGYLQECTLRNYEFTKNVSPEFKGGNIPLAGNILARGKGPLLVGFRATEEPAELKRAHVWQGGVSLIPRPFYFVMKKDERSARIANAVADRINFMYQEDSQKMRVSEAQKQLLLLDDVTHRLNQKHETAAGNGKMAWAHDKGVIDVCVPFGYRFNRERYLRVARLVPLREAGNEESARYRQRLHKMLLEPAETLRAALRLEALGAESVPALKDGLKSDHAMVRFASAEALTYLGNTAGVEELTQLARQNPLLANYCVVALASLDEGICRTRLAELLRCDDTPLRCAAFLALRLVAAHDPPESDGRPNRWLHGEWLNEADWLHQVAPGATPLVTYAVDKRAEIVLYGDGIHLLTPTRLLVGPDYTVTAEPGDDRCTVSRISTKSGQQRKQCSLRLNDVLRTLADLGGSYPDAVDLLRKLEDRQALSCPVRVNTLPPEATLEKLVESSRTARADVPAVNSEPAPARIEASGKR
jgi:hypothetical protein